MLIGDRASKRPQSRELWRLVDLALRRRAPEEHAFLFVGGLAPADGIESVRVVTVFFERVDTVRAVAENDRDLEAPFDAAQAHGALALMESPGVGASERKAVRAWLGLAEKKPRAAKPKDPPKPA